MSTARGLSSLSSVPVHNGESARGSVVHHNQEILEDARAALRYQAQALERLAVNLDDQFCRAVDTLRACRGHAVVCGIGKSGTIGKKIAATLASTGTPSFFLHAAEAAHGDLGMVTTKDVVVLVSNSGATDELIRLLPYIRKTRVPVIAIVGRCASVIARAALVVLDIGTAREICPHNLAPTTSALMTLAMGDILAMATMRLRGFGRRDFAWCHPAGALNEKARRASVAKHRTTTPIPNRTITRMARRTPSGAKPQLGLIQDTSR